MTTYRLGNFTIGTQPETVLVHRNSGRWPAQSCKAAHVTGNLVFVSHYVPEQWRPRLFGPNTAWLVFNDKLHLIGHDAVLETALRLAEGKL